jgi:hypothetical protein
VPVNTIVSKGVSTDRYNIRMLTINDLVKDYDAVMSSVDRLKGVFGPNDNWPNELTLEENLIDLGWHQKEFKIKSSFAFTVMSIDESKCLGCVYINPSSKVSFDAEIIMWVRQSEALSDLDSNLFATIKKWITTDWWFTSVAFPGREITWENWEQLP